TAAICLPRATSTATCSRTPEPPPPNDSGAVVDRMSASASLAHSTLSKRSSSPSSSRCRSGVHTDSVMVRTRPPRSSAASVVVKSMSNPLPVHSRQAERDHADDVALNLVGAAAERQDQAGAVHPLDAAAQQGAGRVGAHSCGGAEHLHQQSVGLSG